jgi:hypothetical protein
MARLWRDWLLLLLDPEEEEVGSEEEVGPEE